MFFEILNNIYKNLFAVLRTLVFLVSVFFIAAVYFNGLDDHLFPWKCQDWIVCFKYSIPTYVVIIPAPLELVLMILRANKRINKNIQDERKD